MYGCLRVSRSDGVEAPIDGAAVAEVTEEPSDEHGDCSLYGVAYWELVAKVPRLYRSSYCCKIAWAAECDPAFANGTGVGTNDV